MDRSQIFIWMMSLCFSVSPFWGVSAETADVAATTAEEMEAAVLEAQDMLNTALESLSEEVQDELTFKRQMIDIIDHSLEVNDALGVDSSVAWQRYGILLPSWLVIGGTFFGQRGLIRNLRSWTPDKRASYKHAFKSSGKLVRDYMSKQGALNTAQSNLSKLQKQAATVVETGKTAAALEASAQVEEGKPAGDGEKTAKVEEGKPAGDGEKTAKAEEGKPAGDGEKTAKVEEGKPAGDGEKTAKVEEGKTGKAAEEAKGTSGEKTAVAESQQRSPRPNRSRRNKKASSTTAPQVDAGAAIKQQEKIVSSLQAEVNQLRTTVTENIGLKMRNLGYRFGRLVRTSGTLVILLGGVPVYFYAIGETIMVVFDVPEDMEALRAQYVQDIEEIMSIAVEEVSS